MSSRAAFEGDYRPGYNPDFARRALARRALADRARAAEELARAEAERRRELDERREMLLAEAGKALVEILAAKAAKRSQPTLLPVTEIERIIRRAMRVFDCSRAHLMGKGRQRRLALARQFVCYWARRRTGLSLPQIGRKLGNRDHTTVIQGSKVYVEKRAAMNRTLKPAR